MSTCVNVIRQLRSNFFKIYNQKKNISREELNSEESEKRCPVRVKGTRDLAQQKTQEIGQPSNMCRPKHTA